MTILLDRTLPAQVGGRRPTPSRLALLHPLEVISSDPPFHEAHAFAVRLRNDVCDEPVPALFGSSPFEQHAGPAAGMAGRVHDPAVSSAGFLAARFGRSVGVRAAAAGPILQGRAAAPAHSAGHARSVPPLSNGCSNGRLRLHELPRPATS